MGIKDRKTRDKARMKKLVLDTAMKLFLADGYESVSMRRIADMIEYSPGTIYLYYRNKAEIFMDLHDMGFRKLYSLQTRACRVKDPWKRLEKHGRAYIEFALKNPRYYDLMFIMEVSDRDEHEVKESEDMGLLSYGLLRENINDCMEAGYIPRADLDIASFSFWSLTHGISSLLLRQRGKMFSDRDEARMIKEPLGYMMDSIRKKQA